MTIRPALGSHHHRIADRFSVDAVQARVRPRPSCRCHVRVGPTTNTPRVVPRRNIGCCPPDQRRAGGYVLVRRCPRYPQPRQATGTKRTAAAPARPRPQAGLIHSPDHASDRGRAGADRRHRELHHDPANGLAQPGTPARRMAVQRGGDLGPPDRTRPRQRTGVHPPQPDRATRSDRRNHTTGRGSPTHPYYV